MLLIREKKTMAKMPSPPLKPSTSDNTQLHNKTDKMKTDHAIDICVTSSQPRYSTSEMLQQLPNINNRFCHIIKVSIPWKDDLYIPNLNAYHKATNYFCTMI
jgi:hypothetical protein